MSSDLIGAAVDRPSATPGETVVTAEPSWLTPTEQSAWRAWLETYRLVLPVLDRQLQSAASLTLSDYEVLVCLSEAPDGLRMGSVADRTVSTRSAISRSIDRLVARGWVRRERSDEDQRGFFAFLTADGGAALAELAPGHVATVRSTLIDLLDPIELAMLERIGRKVRQGVPPGPSTRPGRT